MALTRITKGVIKPNENYDTHNINSTGIITATGANISGNMSVGGVLTYEDVTNVDSVGLITARSGIRFGGHILPTVNESYDIGSADYKVRHLFLSDNSLKFVDSSDTEHPLSVDSGRLKFAGGMLLGSNIKMDTISGIITATNFAKADGSSLGGVQSDSNYNTLGGTGAGNQLTNSTLRNTFFGWDSGTAMQVGEKNTFIGAIAGKFQNNSEYNTGIGDAALCQNSGNYNTSVGYNAAAGESERLTMEHTVAIGYNALRKIDEADFNVAMGSRALENCVTGNSNIAIGYKSLFNANTSSDNVAIGSSTGINLSTAANENTFIGYNAGQGVTTGDRNTAIGMNAMASTDYSSGGKTGSDNIAIGRNTMSRNTGSGSNNVFIGSGNNAYRCSNGSNNIGIGQYTFYYLTTGNSNIALGNQALDYCDTGHSNIALGASALTELTGGSGTNNDNIAIGSGVATNLQNGANNIIIGKNATTSAATVSNEITLGNNNINHLRIPGIGVSFSEGGAVFSGIITATNFAKADGSSLGGVQSDSSYNTLGGTDAGASFNTSGNVAQENTLFGYQAGNAVDYGDGNTVFGYQAMLVSTGEHNTVIGWKAADSLGGSSNANVFIGKDAAGGLSGGCNQNIAIGSLALNDGSGISGNICLGGQAGKEITNNYNVCIGHYAGGSITSLKNGENNIIIGRTASPSAENVSNEITLGNTDITKFRIPGLSISIDSNGISDAKGNLRSLPQNNTSGTYTLVASDAGKHVRATGQITIPSGTFSTGDMITIYNNSGSAIDIVQGSSTTVYDSNDASTGNKSLKARGLCTILCESNNAFVASGNFA